MKVIYNDGRVAELNDAEEELHVLRHTAAHIMAQAIKRLWPETKLAIGPSIDDGFYYDFDRDEAFSAEDLKKIEDEMEYPGMINVNIVRESRVTDYAK